MKVLKKNSRHISALSLLTAPLMILSSLNAFADDLDAIASQIAASATAKQITDEFYSEVPNGGPSNNSALESSLGYSDIEEAVNKQLDPYVIMHLYTPQAEAGVLHNFKYIWGLRIPLPGTPYEDVTFTTCYTGNAPTPAAHACIKKQLSEIVNVPGGLKAALEARNARMIYSFSDFNDYFGDKSLMMKTGSKGLHDLFSHYAQNATSGYQNKYNWIKVASYVDLEGNCHFTSGEKLLRDFDAKVAAQQEAQKSREDFENDLKKSMEPTSN